MTRAGSPRIEGYTAIAAVGLVTALLLRRPELAVLGVPFALVVALGLRWSADPNVTVELALDSERALEGAPVDAELRVRADTPVDRLEVALDVPRGLELEDGGLALAFRLGPEGERTIPLRLQPERWGVYDLGAIETRARDPFRLVVWGNRTRIPHVLRVYPNPRDATRIVAAVETQAFTGSEVARVKGDGIEYADIRDYVPGDRVRSINWRASARRQGLVVSERHPERNTDVVLLMDSFADVRGDGFSTLDEAVRVASALATRYLERRDRVGLIAFGGVLRWLQPGMGSSQRYRLIETLVETGVEPTYTWRDINIIPARILPPKALVVACTSLVDRRFVAALEDLRARGFDLVVVELDPTSVVVPGRGEGAALAHRLWLLEREVNRARLQRLGVGVARWGPGLSLDAALEGVRTYRRHARLARV
ncbi:MAG: DUF58 domain-containing protein [Gaiellaceae bacterium]